MSRRRKHVVMMALLICALRLAAAGPSTQWVPSRAQEAATKIPLCPGLAVVTAISQPEGDYESIKTVESMDARTVRLKYSAEQPPEMGAGGGSRVRKLNTTRVIRVADLLNAQLYAQIFGTNIPVEIAGATAIGTSRAVLLALRTKGQAELGMFDIPPALPGSSSKISPDPKQHPNVFEYAENYKLLLVPAKPAVMVPLIVNDVKTELRAIAATGRSDYYGYKADFLFLDDESNPLALKWRLGIGAGSGANAGGDRNTLQVIKIAYHCNPAAVGQSWLERALAETGHADIYEIFFSFNSDELREESEPTLREIGGIMRRHPDWKLSIVGHTDAIGGDAFNLELSKRRAAAVKNALVARFAVNTARLQTNGYGRSRPVDTNETPEGRARNRRVELVRLP
jgi:outer membrane protein OmpA-like peptidoglycan-associated protein